MPFPTPPVPPDYSHHQQADAEATKRAQEAQRQWAQAEKLRLQQEAERRQREMEAAQRAKHGQTSQPF